MNAPTGLRHSFQLDLSARGYQVLFHRDETNHCPGCGKSQWLVGRVTAECALCGTALPLAEAELGGFNLHARRAVALHVARAPVEVYPGPEMRSSVRRPAEGRVLALHLDGSPHAFLIHNISSGGLMGDALPGLTEARSITVELEDGSHLPAELKWTDGKFVGVAFLTPAPECSISPPEE
jgi:hypothetical protein